MAVGRFVTNPMLIGLIELPGPIYLFCVIFHQILFPFIFPRFLLIHGLVTRTIMLCVGLAVSFAGFRLLGVAKRQFAQSGTPLTKKESPNVLLTSGMFKFSRNPVYMSFMIITFGFALAGMNAISFVIFGIFFCLWNFLTIPYEEAWMEKLFGNEYVNYMKKVRRWL